MTMSTGGMVYVELMLLPSRNRTYTNVVLFRASVVFERELYKANHVIQMSRQSAAIKHVLDAMVTCERSC